MYYVWFTEFAKSETEGILQCSELKPQFIEYRIVHYSHAGFLTHVVGEMDTSPHTKQVFGIWL